MENTKGSRRISGTRRTNESAGQNKNRRPMEEEQEEPGKRRVEQHETVELRNKENQKRLWNQENQGNQNKNQ